VSITSLPLPVVSAIGFIAFPRLAARGEMTAGDHRLLKMAVLVSLAVATAVLLPVTVLATWVVPVVFGAGYRGAVGLVWILMPGGIFIACGQVTGDLLRGRRHLSAVAWSQWIAAAATVALLAALLPLAGVAGAAIASTVAYGVALAAMIRALWKAPGGGSLASPPSREPDEPGAPDGGNPGDIDKVAAARSGSRIMNPGHRKGAGICA
jgi:O-antigen/teichoic acid export membrane protein